MRGQRPVEKRKIEGGGISVTNWRPKSGQAPGRGTQAEIPLCLFAVT